MYLANRPLIMGSGAPSADRRRSFVFPVVFFAPKAVLGLPAVGDLLPAAFAPAGRPFFCRGLTCHVSDFFCVTAEPALVLDWGVVSTFRFTRRSVSLLADSATAY